MADVAVLHQTDIPSSKLPFLSEETASLHTKKPTQSSLRNTSRSTNSSNKTMAWNKNTNNTTTGSGTGGGSGSGNDKNQGPSGGGVSSNIGEKKNAGVKQQVESGIAIPHMDQVSMDPFATCRDCWYVYMLSVCTIVTECCLVSTFASFSPLLRFTCTCTLSPLTIME